MKNVKPFHLCSAFTWRFFVTYVSPFHLYSTFTLRIFITYVHPFQPSLSIYMRVLYHILRYHTEPNCWATAHFIPRNNHSFVVFHFILKAHRKHLTDLVPTLVSQIWKRYPYLSNIVTSAPLGTVGNRYRMQPLSESPLTSNWYSANQPSELLLIQIVLPFPAQPCKGQSGCVEVVSVHCRKKSLLWISKQSCSTF